MPRWQRAYVAACAALIGGALAAVLCQYAAWPRLTYHPYRGDLWFGPPTGSSIDLGFLGIAAWAAVGALVTAAVAAVAGAVSGRALSDGAVRLIGGWAMTAAGLALVHAVWTLWPFG